MVAVIHDDPLALSVLAALSSGWESAGTVALRTGEPAEVVGPLLERAVEDGLATRLDLAGTPVYQLTPQGLDVVGVAPRVDEVVDQDRHVDVRTEAAPTVLEADPAPVSAEPSAVPGLPALAVDPPPGQVKRRYVVYAVGYVLIGLFLVLFVSPVVGLLSVVGGLALGGYALRPMFRTTNDRVTTP
jgi:hypothetical protein